MCCLNMSPWTGLFHNLSCPCLGQLFPLRSQWPRWKHHKPEQPRTCYFKWRFLLSLENNTTQQNTFSWAIIATLCQPSSGKLKAGLASHFPSPINPIFHSFKRSIIYAQGISVTWPIIFINTDHLPIENFQFWSLGQHSQNSAGSYYGFSGLQSPLLYLVPCVCFFHVHDQDLNRKFKGARPFAFLLHGFGTSPDLHPESIRLESLRISSSCLWMTALNGS